MSNKTPPDRIFISTDRQWAKNPTPICTHQYVRAARGGTGKTEANYVTALFPVVFLIFVLWIFDHLHLIEQDAQLDAICAAVECEEGNDG